MERKGGGKNGQSSWLRAGRLEFEFELMEEEEGMEGRRGLGAWGVRFGMRVETFPEVVEGALGEGSGRVREVFGSK